MNNPLPANSGDNFMKHSTSSTVAISLLAILCDCRGIVTPPPRPGPIPPTASQPQSPPSLAAASAPIKAPASSAAAPASQPTGAIAGIVLYAGPPVTPAALSTAVDPACTVPLFSERIVVNPGGTLANVFIHIQSGLPKSTYPPPATPLILDFRTCAYVPHVLGIQTAQPLTVRNASPAAHNFHMTPRRNAPLNFGQPVTGMMATLPPFARAELGIPVKDDVHPWARAYICVNDDPFFNVTGTAGVFRLDNVPIGTYTIEAWHEALPAVRVPAVVTPNSITWLTFTLGTPAATAPGAAGS